MMREDKLERTFSCSEQLSYTILFLLSGSWVFALVFNQWYFSSKCPMNIQQRSDNVTDKEMLIVGKKTDLSCSRREMIPMEIHNLPQKAVTF